MNRRRHRNFNRNVPWWNQPALSSDYLGAASIAGSRGSLSPTCFLRSTGPTPHGPKLVDRRWATRFDYDGCNAGYC